MFPDLAEDWSASEDQTVWTFTLREGVTFHDGSAFEPEDVKATFERIMDEAVGSTIRVNFSIVDEITIDDPRTVTFHLSQPYSGFPELLGDRQARIVPRDKVDMLASEPIGTGPFKFVSYTPGDNIALEKFDSYYKQGQPQLDEVNLRIMPESAAKISAIETGELDLIWSVPMEAVEGLGENEDVRIDSIATSTWDGLIMNASEPPFDDPRVRKAVLMSLDKQALVEFALFGNGTPTHSMIPPTHPYFNDEIAISGPDVEGARALLAEAGYEDGFDITLYLPVGRPTRERLGVAAQQYLAEIGINAELQRVPWDQFIKE
ncbi:MAG: ABC transporter substrate-binding protein, partial [Nitratireductor sp.]